MRCVVCNRQAGECGYCVACMKKIEKRESYLFFKKLYLAVKEAPDDVLEIVFKELDRRSAFGSQKNADAVRVSLDYLKAQWRIGK